MCFPAPARPSSLSRSSKRIATHDDESEKRTDMGVVGAALIQKKKRCHGRRWSCKISEGRETGWQCTMLKLRSPKRFQVNVTFRQKSQFICHFFNVACLASQTSPQPLSDTVPNACDHSLDDIYGPSNSTYPGLNYMAILWIPYFPNIVGLLLQSNPDHFFTTRRRWHPQGKVSL